MLTRALIVLALSAGPALGLELEVPIDCTPGTDCFIQQYVDREPGPGVRDYACGAETYDGHKGIDIRLRTTADVAKSVAVRAAAPGVVMGLRDGMADRLVRNDEDRKAVADHECGNGVRIDQGDGWTTQYCHLRQGSVAVRKGDRVAAGTKLGEVGYSGDAAFAHLHIQVEQAGRIVDPFLPDQAAACGHAANALWSAGALSALGYRPGELIGFGFTDHAPALPELEAGTPLAAPSLQTPAVVYAWAINLEKGDLIDLSLERDGEVVVRNSATLDHNKAQYMLFAGKKAPPGGWLKGAYTGLVKVTRGGEPVISETTSIALD